MAVNERPTCVTVIGWAWIIIGELMCFSALMAVFAFLWTRQMMHARPDSGQDVPTIFPLIPLIVPAMACCVGAVGLVSGIHFLKLRQWARSVLAILAGLLLLLVVGFGIFYIFALLRVTDEGASPGFEAMAVVVGILVTAHLGVPLGIMLKYLVGDRVKAAMGGPVEPSD